MINVIKKIVQSGVFDPTPLNDAGQSRAALIVVFLYMVAWLACHLASYFTDVSEQMALLNGDILLLVVPAAVYGVGKRLVVTGAKLLKDRKAKRGES